MTASPQCSPPAIPDQGELIDRSRLRRRECVVCVEQIDGGGEGDGGAESQRGALSQRDPDVAGANNLRGRTSLAIAAFKVGQACEVTQSAEARAVQG